MTTQEIIEAEQKEWSGDDSVSLYLIDRWGAGYFHVAENGDMTVAPLQTKGISVPILDVVPVSPGCPVPAGALAPGAVLPVTMKIGVALGNNGGAITLLERSGLKVAGVSYTAEQARREGWTVTF